MATPSSVKNKIQGLINSANATTGKKDKDLTSGVNSLIAGYGQGGGSSECPGEHVIKVDELPTENIDENAIYECDGKYYKAGNAELKDIIAVDASGVFSFVDLYSQFGLTFELYYAVSKPTENIVVSGESPDSTLFACYYIEDEDDTFIYADISGSGTNEWISLSMIVDLTNQGAITDIGEATVVGGMYALVEGGWAIYSVAKGNFEIKKNGRYDVAAYANVDVTIPSTCIVQKIAELPSDAPDGSMAMVLGG